MILNSPPQFGQCAMEIWNTRLSSLAQLSRTGRWRVLIWSLKNGRHEVCYFDFMEDL